MAGVLDTEVPRHAVGGMVLLDCLEVFHRCFVQTSSGQWRMNRESFDDVLAVRIAAAFAATSALAASGMAHVVGTFEKRDALLDRAV